MRATGGLPGADGAVGHEAMLLWLPLGAGQPVVERSGRAYERLCAWRDARAPLALYHAALEVTTPTARYAIELAPVPDRDGRARGVVGEGAVGSRWLGGLRWFRYELRCWRDGVIPDRDLAGTEPRRLSEDPERVARLLGLLPAVPHPVWGRDELGLGEMWNSNAAVSWLLATSDLLTPTTRPPPGGRAPGWDAGVALAARSATRPLG